MNEQELKEQLKQEIKQEMKKSARKKRIIILLAIIAIVIGFWAYIEIEKNIKTQEIISQEEFDKYIAEIPITPENWKEYITLEYETVENKDAFGEVISQKQEQKFKIKDNMFGYVVLKFSIDENFFNKGYDNEKIVTLTNNNSAPTNYVLGLKNNIEITINDLQCIQSKGVLYKIDIPEELWKADKHGQQIIKVGNRNSYTTYFKDDNELVIDLSIEAQNKYKNNDF